jgi:hypothetical protein
LPTAVHDLRFLHGHATTALTWLIIAAPEAMPPVTDHDCSKKLKALLRKAGERTRDGLWSAIAHILQLYTPADDGHHWASYRENALGRTGSASLFIMT